MDSKNNKKFASKKLFVLGKMINHITPRWLRFVFSPIKLILWYVSLLRLNLWIIIGEENFSKQKLTIIYAGNETNRHFMMKLAFDGSYKENYIGKKWLWRIAKTAKKRSNDSSLMIADVPKFCRLFLKEDKFLYIPSWIYGEVDISTDNSSFLKYKSIKSDMRRIRKNKLNFQVTDDQHQLHNFYYNMYLPHITKIHGDGAFIESYDSIEKKIKKCEMLFIKKEEEYIAGSLLEYKKNVVHLWCLGIKDGDLCYVKDGAIGALFHFSTNHAREKGYNKVDFGPSRAFLRYGVLQFKMKRGLQIVDTSKEGFIIKPLSKSDAVKGFFLNNPFIYVSKTRLNGAIFFNSDHSFSKEECEKIYKDYYVPGLSKLVIYRFGKVNDKIQEAVPPEFSNKMTICSAESFI